MTYQPAFKTRAAKLKFMDVYDYRNLHEDESAILLGNGPSLVRWHDKLEALQERHCVIGINRSWMGAEGECALSRDPYHVIFGELHGIELVLGRYETGVVFTNKSCLKSLVGYKGEVVGCDNRGDWRHDGFVFDIQRGTSAPFGGLFAIQVAAWMGFTTIYLLGYDMGIRAHHYNDESDGFDRSQHSRHFYGVKKWADVAGVDIFNANPESAIKEFPTGEPA